MQIVETDPGRSIRRQSETTLPLPPGLLAAIAIDYAAYARFELVDEPDAGERTFERVRRGTTHDIWLIRWGVGSRTELHDHGGSTGALYVAAGALVEHRPNPAGTGRALRRELRQFSRRPMSTTHVHAVANESGATAASIHVYSPPLATMQHYDETDDSQLRPRHREVLDPDTLAANVAPPIR